jgi:hypothetical protein
MEKLNSDEVKEFMKWKKTNGKAKKLEIQEGVSIDASSVNAKVKKEKRKCSEKQLAALAAGRQKQIEKMLSLAKSKQ